MLFPYQIRFTSYRLDVETVIKRINGVVGLPAKPDGSVSYWENEDSSWAENWFSLGTGNNWDLFRVETSGKSVLWELRYRYSSPEEMKAVLLILLRFHGFSDPKYFESAL